MRAFNFIDGELQSCLDVADRGLHYGHGVFETMRLSNSDIPLWSYHKKRLMAGAEALGLSFDANKVCTYLKQAQKAFPNDGIIKLLLTAGVSPRGYRYKNPQPSCIVQYFSSPEKYAGSSGTHLQLCQYRLPSNPRLAGVKHLNRLDQILAAQELDEGFDGLMLDGNGDVVEALSSNIFIFDQDKAHWLTPALASCGVSGVMRALLCDKIIPAMGQTVEIETFDLETLLKSNEVFMSNALVGVRPVIELQGHKQWAVGAETQRVMDALKRVFPCFGD